MPPTMVMAGEIIVWSDGDTYGKGTYSAMGGINGGNGGLVEFSGKENAAFDGTAYTKARHNSGTNGTLLLDPKNIIIDDATGVFPQFEYLNPTPNAGDLFGDSAVEAGLGATLAITDPGDDAIATDAGAVYLYNRVTGALISTLTGSAAGNEVGQKTSYSAVEELGVKSLSNGNIIVRSPFWDNGAINDTGAVTWMNGITGQTSNGLFVVNAGNSLVGSSSFDRLSTTLSIHPGIVDLGNGNYVVNTPYWDSGAVINVGAVTWGNGTTGIQGTINSTNSLVGTVAGDALGRNGIKVLTNNNYVISSPLWDNASIVNVGAATWGNGLSGVVGFISPTNSLIGSQNNDLVGFIVTVLTNGNYVVGSYNWRNGSNANAGAATWGNGLSGIVGVVSPANSLVGTQANDSVGYGVHALTNGNYVVNSYNWRNGTFSSAGAVTWGNGLGGTVGAVSASNSLVGGKASDGYYTLVTPLTNGNYVVRNYYRNNGSIVNAGAVTWGNGSGGTVGSATAANSLVGSKTNDQVGSGSVIALTNGNYVVGSGSWDNGAIVNAGAATWGNGNGGTIGTISSANSLVGSKANDQVASQFNSLTALSNGNYTVSSINWDNNTVVDAGAVTWSSGITGITGLVSTANSLVGTQTNDRVGSQVRALSNGNYVVFSYDWDNGSVIDSGAVTWGNGSTGITGIVSPTNSLVANTPNSRVGFFSNRFIELQDGNYLITSMQWDNGAINDAGAITWADGTKPITGIINAQNSILGKTANQDAGTSGYNILPTSDNGFVYFDNINHTGVIAGLPDANMLTFNRAEAQDITITSSALTRQLDAGTNLTLQANNDITINSAITANNPSGNGGDLTFQAGRSIIVNGAITTDSGNLTLQANTGTASGTIDAYRDAGAANINLNANINTGTGSFLAWLDTGLGLTNNTAGSIDIGTSGSITSSATGKAITLASSNTFINQNTGSPFSTPNGYYHIYSNSPLTDTLNGFVRPNKRYNISYGDDVSSYGTDYFFYSIAPTLTLTADTQTYTYNSLNQLDGTAYSLAGFIDGDDETDLSGSANLITADGTNAGTRDITVAAGTLAGLGYSFTTNNTPINELTINKAALSFTSLNQHYTYNATGSQFNTNAFNTVGLQGSDTLAGQLAGTVTVQSADTITATNGTARLITVNTTGATSSNYSFATTNTGQLSIDKASLSFTSPNQNYTYNATDNQFDNNRYSVSGLQGSDTLAGQLTGTIAVDASNKTAATNGNPRTIRFTASGANSQNYLLSFTESGQLTIQQASRTVIAANASKLAGTADPDAFLYNLDTPLFGADTFSGTLARAPGEGTADYAIVQHTLDNSNYDLTYAPGVFSIMPATLPAKPIKLLPLPNTVRRTPETKIAEINMQNVVFGKLYTARGRNNTAGNMWPSLSNPLIPPLQSSLTLEPTLANWLEYPPNQNILTP